MSEAPARPPMFLRVPVTRVGRPGGGEDAAAVEEPLEVRLHGRPFAVIMRTPGDDRALAAGFLLSEGVVTSLEDVGAIEHCRHPQHPDCGQGANSTSQRGTADPQDSGEVAFRW